MSLRLTLFGAIVLWAIVSVLVSAAWAGGTDASMPPNPSRQQAAIEGIMVKFRGDLDPTLAVTAGERLSKAGGVKLRFERQMGGGVVLYKFPPRGEASVQALVKKLQADPSIEFVEADSIMTIQKPR
jgi:hypothetical protein